MIAALVCPGPSVLRTFDPVHWTRYEHRLVACVNRAALWFGCDYWCALDPLLVRSIADDVRNVPTRAGVPMLATSLIGNLERHGLVWPRRFPVDSLFGYCPPVLSWTLYTATAGLVVLAHAGATDIRVYGADWTDEPDADGKRPPCCDRGGERWAREGEIWAATRNWLAGRGIRVERILP